MSLRRATLQEAALKPSRCAIRLSDVRPVAPGERSVSGGFLEMSAVQPTTEMTTMIETSRLVEANLNVMKSHNEMLQGLIERVLKA